MRMRRLPGIASWLTLVFGLVAWTANAARAQQAVPCASEGAFLRSVASWPDVQGAIDARRPHGIEASQDAPIPSPFIESTRALLNPASKEDVQHAFRALSQLAQDGDPEAALIVGFMHARGMGTPANYCAASAWFCRAGDGGIEEIKYAMRTHCPESQ
jgi:TPR repeat protein